MIIPPITILCLMFTELHRSSQSTSSAQPQVNNPSERAPLPALDEIMENSSMQPAFSALLASSSQIQQPSEDVRRSSARMTSSRISYPTAEMASMSLGRSGKFYR